MAWPVSATFIKALSTSHQVITQCTYRTPDAATGTVQVKAGTITVDDTAGTRRRGNLTAYGTTDDFAALTLPGTVLTLLHGIALGGNIDELVPLFKGEVASGSQDFGGGEITLPVVDFSVWIGRSSFITPYAPVSTMTRINAIKQIITDAFPTATFRVTATDTGVVGVGKTWSGSRLDAINSLATDGSMEAFFGPDGVYVIRNFRAIGDAPDWTMQGVVKSLARARPSDRMYNTVVVSPAATDGSQTWTQQVVTITDPTHPRYPGKIGTVPLFITSATAASAAEAQQTGLVKLNRVQGNTETLALASIANPGLEGSDILRISVGGAGTEPSTIFQHQIDSVTTDLVTGLMSAQTRNQDLDALS